MLRASFCNSSNVHNLTNTNTNTNNTNNVHNLIRLCTLLVLLVLVLVLVRLCTLLELQKLARSILIHFNLLVAVHSLTTDPIEFISILFNSACHSMHWLNTGRCLTKSSRQSIKT